MRENGYLGQKVDYLKIPYMIREASVADLARTVSFMPNLRYADLPDSLYKDEPSASFLAQELQTRCPNLRQMRYFHGSEGSFLAQVHSRRWRDLEAIELSHLAVEPNTIINVFNSLTSLREVKMIDLPLLDDSIFESSAIGSSLPPLVKISLEETPNVSADGLVNYISQPASRSTLTHLSLQDTGVSASELYRILLAASSLTTLHIVTSVNRALNPSQIPVLRSPSLKTLHYEISDGSASPDGLQSPSDSYYTYLSSSVRSGSLPSLCHLYALSDAPQDLLQPAPHTFYSGNRTNEIPPPLSLGIKRPLKLYTKAIKEMEWDITLISPPSPAHRRGSVVAAGPESLYHPAPLSPQYRNTGRDSAIVGNGFGGFLAVPTPDLSPGSPQLKNQKKDMDAWMG